MQSITNEQQKTAELLSSKIEDPIKRQKAYTDFVCALFFINFMLGQNFVVSTKRSLFKCKKLYLDFDIIDVYSNSHRLYILTTNSNSVEVPILHKTCNILPEFYVVMQLNTTTHEPEILGVIDPITLNVHKNNDFYYSYDVGELLGLDVLVEKLQQKLPPPHSIGSHLECIKLLDSYVKNKLTKEEEQHFISHIVSCESCKKKLVDTLNKEDSCVQPRTYNTNFTKKLFKEEENTGIKSALDEIYKEKIKFTGKDLLKHGAEFPAQLKKPLILIIAIFIILIVLITGIFGIMSPKKDSSKEVQGIAIEDIETEEYNNSPSNYDINLPPVRTNKVYTTVSKVSWEVSSNINKEEQKRFLQQTGKTIKLNLQNDLLLSNEAVVNSGVKFEIKFYRDGSLENIEVVKSSGSKAIDSIIQQSIKNTLYYIKPPKGAFVGNRNSLILNIEF